MVEIDMSIHDIFVEYDGITFIGENGEKVKFLMNEREKNMLQERLKEGEIHI